MVVVVLVLVLVEDKEGEEERLEASIIGRNRGATVES